MGRSGKAVNAAVLAALVGIYRLTEEYVRWPVRRDQATGKIWLVLHSDVFAAPVLGHTAADAPIATGGLTTMT